MKAKLVNKKLMLVALLFSSIGFLKGCTDEDEFEFIGNSSIEGKLQYQDVKSGSVKDVQKGTLYQVYFESQTTPILVGQTTQDGFWSYVPPAIGSYTIEISRKDTLIQFLSNLVRMEDLDTTRSNEFIILEYRSSSSVSVIKNEQKQSDIILVFDGTGLRVAVKDENGQPIKGASLCLYSNETFYLANFPNCGGSLKYIETDENGSALFLGLLPNTTYYINGRAKVGVVNISNHDDSNSQKLKTGSTGEIIKSDLILK